jgi:hypothetical protein
MRVGMVLDLGTHGKITVCQDIADSLDEGVRTDAIVIYFSKTFDLVPHDKNFGNRSRCEGS